MRKTLITIMAAIAALASCQKNEITELQERSVITAHIEQADVTRTMMDEDNNIRWSEGDQIVAFMKTSLGRRYQVQSSYVGETFAAFDDVSGTSGTLTAGTELSHNVAYYPYASSITCEKSGPDYVLNVTLPAEQAYKPGSFGNGSFPMAAASETNEMTFRNICGGMKLQFKGTQKLASIKIEGKNSEKLSGAAVVTAYTDGTKPSIRMASDASASVTLDCGEGVQLNENTATEFIITIPPVVFSKGFTVTVTDTEGYAQTIGTDKSNEVKRSSLLVMPEVTVEESAQVPDYGTFDENQYIIYNKYDKLVISGDSYWEMNPFFKSRVSDIQEIEMKFQLSSEEKAYMFYSERPYRNNGVLINSDGIVLRWGNRGYNVVTNEKIITWQEIGVSQTAEIIMNISLSRGTATINGKQFDISETGSFTDIGYLFSSYYYENDDGYAKCYDGVPDGSKLYYVKAWSSNGELTYHGYAVQAEYSDGSLQYAWKSIYNGNICYEFSRTNFQDFWVYQYSDYWSHFGGGIDETRHYLTFDDGTTSKSLNVPADPDEDNSANYFLGGYYVYYLDTDMTEWAQVEMEVPEDAKSWMNPGMDWDSKCWVIQIHDNTTTSERSALLRLRAKSNPEASIEINITQAGLPEGVIMFDNLNVKTACLAFDTNGDGELTETEAAAVTDLSAMTFPKSVAASFNEFEYFTSVANIPDNFFAGSKLTAIKFPSSLKTIGKYAFNECTQLTAINLPENVELLYGAFRACTGLTELTIPSGTTWTTDAFYKCAGLESVNISAGVSYIPDCAFQDCTNLTSVTISSTVKKLSSMVFYNCSSLESITIPDSVTQISSGVFYNCQKLATVILSKNISRLQTNCFYNCSMLKDIVIPENVMEIGIGCFSYCTALNTVSVKSVTPPTLSDYIFDDCSNLSKIYVPSASQYEYQNGSYWSRYKSLMVGKIF